MRFGVTLPRVLDGDALCRFAEKADDLGFESLWTGDHIVLATVDRKQYPYSADGTFLMAPDAPYHEVMIELSYIASSTRRIQIGSTVIILPYRNPILQAKMFASLDVLTNGRVICGVGVGWMEKEFEALGVPYADRGLMSSEYLQIFRCLWTQDHPEFHGRFHSFDGIQLHPKPVRDRHIPIWVGGHTRKAINRAVELGDAWHPSRQTPDFVASRLPYLRRKSEESGRDPNDITVSLKRSLHFTDISIPEGGGIRSGASVVATTRQVIDDVLRCQELGINQLTYDFRTGDIEQCIRTMEHFAETVFPAV